MNLQYAINVKRLRDTLYPKCHSRIPLDIDDCKEVEVFNTKGESIGKMMIHTIKSRNVGTAKTRGGRGHRLFVECPGGCDRLIPVGRLHQHFGYKH